MRPQRNIKFMIAVVIVIYLIAMSIILLAFNSHGNNKKEEDPEEVIIGENNLALENTFVYILTSSKKKYERLLPSDLLCVKISDLSFLKNNISESSNQELNADEILNELNNKYYFTKNELIDLSSSEKYILNDKMQFDFLDCNNIGTKEDVIKNKILDYSFLGYSTFEVPHKERLTNSIEIGFDDMENVYSYSEYNNVKEQFELGMDMDVMIFKQNNIDYKISTLINCAKLININDEYATVCVLQNDGELLKQILDKENVLISLDDISTKEDVIIE